MLPTTLETDPYRSIPSTVVRHSLSVGMAIPSISIAHPFYRNWRIIKPEAINWRNNGNRGAINVYIHLEMPSITW